MFATTLLRAAQLLTTKGVKGVHQGPMMRLSSEPFFPSLQGGPPAFGVQQAPGQKRLPFCDCPSSYAGSGRLMGGPTIVSETKRS